MDNHSDLLSDIRETAKALSDVFDQAFVLYTGLVDSVLQSQITDECEIEHIMDGLSSFEEDESFLDLHKKLYRHVYYNYPNLVGELDAIFRAQFMESGESGNLPCGKDQ